MDKFLEVCKILKETMNCSAGITGTYESPARVTKDYEQKKHNWDKMLKGGLNKEKK